MRSGTRTHTYPHTCNTPQGMKHLNGLNESVVYSDEAKEVYA